MLLKTPAGSRLRGLGNILGTVRTLLGLLRLVATDGRGWQKTCVCVNLAASLLAGGCAVWRPWVDAARGLVMPLSPIEDRAAAIRHCIRHTEELHAARGRSFHLALLEREADILRNLVERSLNYRAGMIALDAGLRKKLALRAPLSGEDLATLKHSEALHLQLRAELIALAAAHECWLSDDAAARWRDWLEPPERRKGILLSLASAIVLYDNYLLAMSLYQDSVKLRRYLNNPDIGYGIESGELHRSSLSFMSAGNRRRMRQALVFYEHEAAVQRPAWGGD
jgi:hypothetical protein